ncbi:MAG: CysS/YqeB C-terminal domain-containing protein [Anaerolineae bacterium]
MDSSSLGQIAFLGSGETSLAGGRIFEMLARRLPQPLRIAVLETPAGFELNSDQVAGRVAEFLRVRLQNFRPQVDVIPARKRGTPFSPDNPQILQPLLRAHLIFLGPGSPTYAARQLNGSLAWDLIRARHRLGATLAFASAATISVGAWVLPVYEIYKVGEDVHTKTGLNLFADFGMHLSFVPHWNNAEGGSDVDTSRCFVGMERFAQWCALLPAENTIVGLDEHTGLILDLEQGICEVRGVSSVSLVRNCEVEMYPAGARFSLSELGNFQRPQPLERGISAEAWQMALQARQQEKDESPSPEVLALLEERRLARSCRDFATSDALRQQIAALGWQVQDTPEGQKLVKIDP